MMMYIRWTLLFVAFSALLVCQYNFWTLFSLERQIDMHTMKVILPALISLACMIAYYVLRTLSMGQQEGDE